MCVYACFYTNHPKGTTDLIILLKLTECTEKLLSNIRKYFSLRKLALLIHFLVSGHAFYFTFRQSVLFEHTLKLIFPCSFCKVTILYFNSNSANHPVTTNIPHRLSCRLEVGRPNWTGRVVVNLLHLNALGWAGTLQFT